MNKLLSVCLLLLGMAFSASAVTLDTAPLPFAPFLQCDAVNVSNQIVTITVTIIAAPNLLIATNTCITSPTNRFCSIGGFGDGNGYCEIDISGTKALARGALHLFNGTTLIAVEDAN